MADIEIAPLAPGERAALFFDVDGTLTWSERDELGTRMGDPAPSPATYEAFRRLAARGHKAFICTGRPLCIISQDLRDLELAGIVSGAGACLTLGDELVFEQALPQDVVLKSIELFMEHGVDVMLEGTAGSVELVPSGSPTWSQLGVPHARDLASTRELKSTLSFLKFCFHGGEFEKLGADIEFFEKHFSICDLGIENYEMSALGVDKGSGIKRAVEALGEGPWRTYGFGDSENDLPMLRAVDVPVAMGNALPAVKDASAYVSCHAKDDGVAHALETLHLI